MDVGYESEEYDLEKPDTNIQEIIEEMKKRRRTYEDVKAKDKTAAKAKQTYQDFNPLRQIQDHEGNLSSLKYKLVTLVSLGHCVVGAVFHMFSSDNSAEFDPYFIQRIKNCL